MWEEVKPWLQYVAGKLPFDALAVNKELIERLDAEEKRREETDENPYSFEWLVRNNMLDCRRHLSPRDKVWFGKFVYLDRRHNKRWNRVLDRAYPYRVRGYQ